MKNEFKQYAIEFARSGGKTKSPARAAASRRNGRKGGRPKKVARPRESKDSQSGILSKVYVKEKGRMQKVLRKKHGSDKA